MEPVIEFRERIRALRDELVATVREIVPDGLSELPQPFTAYIKNDGRILALSVTAILQDKGVYLIGTRVRDGEKLMARDDQLDCETLLDVLARMQTRGDFPDGSKLLPSTFSEEDDVGKFMGMLVGVQKYHLKLPTKNGLKAFGPYFGGDRLGLKLGQLDGQTAEYRLDGETNWKEITIQF
jgi:hypothetical protein